MGVVVESEFHPDDSLQLIVSEPDVWLKNFEQVMQSTTQPGRAGQYGNFWAKRPCRWLPHDWALLMETCESSRSMDREVRRCQRCGSQVHQWWLIPPPLRGRI